MIFWNVDERLGWIQTTLRYHIQKKGEFVYSHLIKDANIHVVALPFNLLSWSVLATSTSLILVSETGLIIIIWR